MTITFTTEEILKNDEISLDIIKYISNDIKSNNHVDTLKSELDKLKNTLNDKVVIISELKNIQKNIEFENNNLRKEIADLKITNHNTLNDDDIETLKNDLFNSEEENKELKKENDELSSNMADLRNKLDNLEYEFNKLNNLLETNENVMKSQENTILKLKEENNELKFVIDEKNKFIEEINSIEKVNTINKIKEIQSNTNEVLDDKEIQSNTNEVQFETEENRILKTFNTLNNEEKEIINELVKFKEIVIQSKKDTYKYKVYPLKSHFNDYQDEYRIATSKKATKKSVALFVYNSFDHKYFESVDYILRKKGYDLHIKKSMKGNVIFEKVNSITKYISIAIDMMHYNLIEFDDKKIYREIDGDYDFKLTLISNNLYKIFKNIEFTKDNLVKYIPQLFEKYKEVFEYSIDLNDNKYDEEKYKKLVDILYDKLKSKLNEDNYNKLNDIQKDETDDDEEYYDKFKQFKIIEYPYKPDTSNNSYSTKFEEFKSTLPNVDKVDLSDVKWGDINTYDKFNTNFIKKYYKYGSIWKNTSVLNKLGLTINHFEKMKEFENDEFYNYVCNVFEKVQDTNIN